MIDDGELRKADRILSQVEKTFKADKQKDVRDLLLHQSLEGGADHLKVVQRFKEDSKVLQTFKREGSMFLQALRSRTRCNTCLGLLAARLMFL